MTINSQQHAGQQHAETPVPAPAQRIALGKVLPDFYKAMSALDAAASDGLDPTISELIKVRASQLNHCAYCLDMHTHDARELGESEHRLHTVAAWRETPFFTARERAALALVEAVTLLPDGIEDEVYDAAEAVFDERELAALIAMCVTINAWNRIGVTSRMSPAAR